MAWNRHAGVNRYRRYAVTVMDNWTPMRLFWTLNGARRWHQTFISGEAHMFHWDGHSWRELHLSPIEVE
jgi:hypothetical protein